MNRPLTRSCSAAHGRVPRRAAALIASVCAAGLLAGCMPLAITGMATGALVASDRRTLGAQTEDQGIELKGNTALAEKLPAAKGVSITSYNRKVLLTGQVPDADTKARAARLVGELPNVRSVQNEITVAARTGVGSYASDVGLTTRVKTALRRVPQRDACTQTRHQFSLDAGHGSSLDRRHFLGRAGRCRHSGLACEHEAFGAPHAQAFFNHAAREHRTLRRVVNAEQHLRVPDAQQSFRKISLTLRIQRQESQGVGHRGPAAPHPLRRRFLREIKVPNQAGVTVRLFHGIQALALQVLNQTERRRRGVARLHHTRRDDLDLEKLERPPAPLTRHQLILVTVTADDDRLQQTFTANALRQFLQLLRHDLAPRLVGTRLDRRDHDIDEPGRGRRGGRRGIRRRGSRSRLGLGRLRSRSGNQSAESTT